MQIDHDLNGRVGPPRCHECNAPLGIDDAAFAKKIAIAHHPRLHVRPL